MTDPLFITRIKIRGVILTIVRSALEYFKGSPKRIAGLLVFLLVLASIPVTLALVGQNQDLREKAAGPDLPDIDVTYIARTPRYYRYCVEYPSGVPKLCAGTENYKRWPSVGETITYTAHIINKGNQSIGSFTFQWIVDGTEKSSGTAGPLAAGQELTVDYPTTWPSIPQSIQFKTDPSNIIGEITKNNNSLTIRSNDLTLSIWIEKGLYDIFNNTINLVGSYSFEDWVQSYFSLMNERFLLAKYPVSLEGIKDRVRIDKIVVADELDGSTSPMRTDPDLYLIDGRWQFTDGDPTNTKGQNGAWQDYVNRFATATNTDWGLIHEIAHQLGIIDLYRMNMINLENNNNRGIQVTGLDGKLVDATKLPPVFTRGGLMGGGDISPYTD
ncbi:MAG: CARDB domain-containing protein, partial [bacterium]|nr:CARDB domain-containing protein [bacterium]